MIEALKEDGVTCAPIIDCGRVSAGMRLVFFRDPEGNIIELMENHADEI